MEHIEAYGGVKGGMRESIRHRYIIKKPKTMPAHMQKLCPNIFPKILLIEKFLIDSVFVHFKLVFHKTFSIVGVLFSTF